MLQIPKITDNFVWQGFKTLDHIGLFEPDIALNFHYPDCAFFALLMEIKNPKHILDLGSYFGMLPILSEQLHTLYGDNKKFNWTLIDNCLYVKELADFVRGKGEFSNRWLRNYHLKTWRLENIKPWKQRLFEVHGEYCVPPSTPEEFNVFWEKFTSYYKLGNPAKEMYSSLASIPDQRKFDLVMFDLAADGFEQNQEIFLDLTANYINHDAIIVMDDILPRHPRGFALFQWIIDNTEFKPLAFSTNKIALQRNQYKSDFMTLTENAGYRANGSFDNANPQQYFNFFFHNAYKWGDYLNLRAN